MDKNTNKQYANSLKHPLWQKKRLEIMQRDNFTCQICGRGINDGTPLNVHHKKYIYGRQPWEYDDDNFITLCQDCHNHNHQSTKHINMNVRVFFRALLRNKKLSANEKLILSFLLQHSIYNYKEMISQNKLAKKLNISQTSISRFYNSNIEIKESYKENGYFQLQVESGLRGELLIFYSWLIDIFSSGIVYCNRQKLAEMYHVRMEDIRDYIQRLKKQDFIRRDKNNNLIINKDYAIL